MENTGNFRKALFGFNTKDVMEYIAMLHNEFYAYRQQSEKEIYDLIRKIDEFENTAEKQQETVFGAEHAEILDDLNNADAEKLAMTADRLEGILNKIEELLDKEEEAQNPEIKD
ncbi:MAG: hypothetical protein IJW86_07935 [Clostridia bacterium]|nr:hypothetical protein [Clostridia bacterium]